MLPKKSVEIKAYSKSELAELYRVKKDKFRRLLNEVENGFAKNVRILTPVQVKRFFDLHGQPDNY